MSADISQRIWHACDILRRDDNCSGVMEYIEHLSWLMFLRFIDQIAIDTGPVVNDKFSWQNWSNLSPADLLPFVHDELIPHLQTLPDSPVASIIKGVFADRNVVVCASGHNLQQVIDIIGKLSITQAQDVFVVSQVYEELLQRMGSENRVAGEFYTPRPLIKLMIELIDPQSHQTVYDPACGTCGFLVQAHLHKNRNPIVVGREKKAIPALLGLMNLIIHKVLHLQIWRENTLTAEDDDRYDIIVTNPPFGGTEGKQIQSRFPIKSQSTELLFLQHIMDRLKQTPGSRCGIIVPEGVLFRTGAFSSIRARLLTQFNLHTIISLPPGAFAPYSDVKTAILLFDYPGPTEKIMYCTIPIKTRLSRTNPLTDDHLNHIRKLYRHWQTVRQTTDHLPSTDHSWLMTVKSPDMELTPVRPGQSPGRVQPPEQIIQRLLSINSDIENTLQKLHRIINQKSH